MSILPNFRPSLRVEAAACIQPVKFEPLLSAAEAAELLRVHPVTLLRWDAKSVCLITV